MDAECRALQRELKQAESSMLTSNKSRYGTRTNARKNIFNAARHSYVIKIHEIPFPDFFDIGKFRPPDKRNGSLKVSSLVHILQLTRPVTRDADVAR